MYNWWKVVSTYKKYHIIETENAGAIGLGFE